MLRMFVHLAWMACDCQDAKKELVKIKRPIRSLVDRIPSKLPLTHCLALHYEYTSSTLVVVCFVQ